MNIKTGRPPEPGCPSVGITLAGLICSYHPDVCAARPLGVALDEKHSKAVEAAPDEVEDPEEPRLGTWSPLIGRVPRAPALEESSG
jgi:hypothetical protein